MNILFFSDNFPPEVNAAASRVYERAAIWVRDGHTVTVITSAPNFPQGRVYAGYRNRLRQTEVIDGIRVVRVWTFVAANDGFVLRIVDFISYMVMSFFAAFLERRPDVVTSTSPQFFCAVAAWLHAKIRRLPYVFELSDLWPASITAVGAMKAGFAIRLLERLELFLYRQSDMVVALTQDFRRNLMGRGIPASKIAVIPNGVDLSRYAPRDADPKIQTELALRGKFTVGYFGTHGMAHGLTSVLETAAICQNSAPQLVFLFVGDGAAKPSLIEEARARGLTNTIFAGPFPKSEMPSWWSVADIALVSLKKAELFSGVLPSKIFEAMGMGLPIAFFGPAGEASALIHEEEVGIVVPPEDSTALAAALERLSGNPSLMAEMRAASSRAAQRHSREAQANRMLDVYRDVITRRVETRRGPNP